MLVDRDEFSDMEDALRQSASKVAEAIQFIRNARKGLGLTGLSPTAKQIGDVVGEAQKLTDTATGAVPLPK